MEQRNRKDRFFLMVRWDIHLFLPLDLRPPGSRVFGLRLNYGILRDFLSFTLHEPIPIINLYLLSIYLSFYLSTIISTIYHIYYLSIISTYLSSTIYDWPFLYRTLAVHLPLSVFCTRVLLCYTQ
jgi:hypothetical protein